MELNTALKQNPLPERKKKAMEALVMSLAKLISLGRTPRTYSSSFTER
jgi:hypothetical protein